MKPNYQQQYTEEAIRARMLKNAAGLWQVNNTHSFDPLLIRLIELYSKEVFLASQQVNNVEPMLMDKVADVLTPGIYTSGRPAHAILQCRPKSPTALLHPLSEFVYKKPATDIGARKDHSFEEIVFTPVDAVHLFDARVAAIVSHQSFCIQQNDLKKQVHFNTITGQRLPATDVWIGLEINNGLESLDGLSLYFHWNDSHFEPWQYELLSFATLSAGHLQLNAEPGLNYASATSVTPGQSLPEHLMPYIIAEMKAVYNKKFLTIRQEGSSLNIAAAKERYPAVFADYFTPNDLDQLKTSLLWLQLQIPVKDKAASLDHLSVAVNAVPVLNRRYNRATYDLHGRNEVFTMPCVNEEAFLALSSVSGSRDRYTFSEHDEEMAEGTYKIQQKHRTRFDARSINHFIAYIRELMRDEVVAFHEFGTTFLKTTIAQLQQYLNEARNMEYMVKGGQSSTNVPYLTLHPSQGESTIEIGYWSTHYELANNINSGHALIQSNTDNITPDSLLLLSATTGGKYHTAPHEKVNAYRYAVTTRDRLVTRNDIRDFCLYELNGLITDAMVERGRMISPHPKEGWVLCLNIKLMVPDKARFTLPEWNNMCFNLLNKLEMKTADTTRYHISVHQM